MRRPHIAGRARFKAFVTRHDYLSSGWLEPLMGALNTCIGCEIPDATMAANAFFPLTTNPPSMQMRPPSFHLPSRIRFSYIMILLRLVQCNLRPRLVLTHLAALAGVISSMESVPTRLDQPHRYRFSPVQLTDAPVGQSHF